MVGISTIVGIIVFLIIFLEIIKHGREKGFDVYSLFLMTLVLAILTMIFFPEEISSIAPQLGFKHPIHITFSLVSITALFFAIKLYFKTKELERNITEIVRYIAILEGKKKK